MISPFYDSKSGNDYVVQTPVFSDVMTQENLFYIEKRMDGVAVGLFYILFGNIYMCPSLFDVLTAKLERASSHLEQLLLKVQSN